MRVAIIEDEQLAAEKLVRYLQKYNSEIKVLSILPSLEEAIPWIHIHYEEVDVFFMDVQLTDGLSFEIFSQIKINKPVIFTTAYDEFAIDAFKVNSIDYLLKPISFTDLSNSLRKLDSVKAHFSDHIQAEEIIKQIESKKFKGRFLVQMGNHIHSIASNELSYFYAEGRDVFLVNGNGRKYLIEYRLETLEELLDPKLFFRINRSFLVRMPAISDVIVHSNRRLKLVLNPKIEREVIVSREKVGDFKKWFSGE